MKLNLLKNKQFFLTNIMILNSIIMMMLNNIIQLWIMMEINTLIMILLISINTKNNKTSFNYFIIQSISSLILITLMIIKSILNMELMNFFILLTFMMKLSMFPFFFWLPLINVNINWMLIFFMTTTQKIPPLIFMNMYLNQINNQIYNYLILLTILMSSMLSTILSVYELNIKKIMSFSSLNHSSWMLIIMTNDQSMFMLYFISYFISMTFICLIFNKFNISFINQLIKISSLTKKMFMISLILNLLIISSLPPFLTFLFKLNSLKIMIFNMNNLTLTLYFIILSIMTLIFYTNLIIKINLSYSIYNKFMYIIKNQMKLKFINILMIMFFSINLMFLMIL